jgi:hypothetical protein
MSRPPASADVARLLGLAEARRARDLARLEALIAEARRIEAEIDALVEVRRRDLVFDPEGGLPLGLQGRRQAHVEREIAERRRQLRALEPALAAVRDAARQSLGKHEALARLRDMAGAAEERARAARAEREAVGLPRQPRDPGF